MSEIVERVARAIYLAQATIDDHSGGTNDLALQTDMHWESCIPHARAAILAMREPTARMCDVVYGRHGEENGSSKPVQDTWRAMVDEAIK